MGLYNIKEQSKFINGMKGHKYEIFFKLMIAYQISRAELLNLRWTDIDFENNTITIYPINKEFGKWDKNYPWHYERYDELKREYPLLQGIKSTLIDENAWQRNNSTSPNYYHGDSDYVCLRANGKRLNGGTLSRNIQYILRDNDLPKLLYDEVRESFNKTLRELAPNSDLYLAWTRLDIQRRGSVRGENIYSDLDLNSKGFIVALNKFIETGKIQEAVM